VAIQILLAEAYTNLLNKPSAYLTWNDTYSIVGNFAWCKILRFSRHAGGLRKFLRNNFRTLDDPSSLFQDLCGSPPCDSFAAQWTFDAPCVSTNSKRIVEIVFVHGFLWGNGERLPSLLG